MLADIPTATVTELVNISRSLKGLNLWNDSAIETAVNDRSITLLSGATASEIIKKNTNDWGANIIFEPSGATKAYEIIFDAICPAGKLVIVGNPMDSIPMDFATILTKEIEIKTVFRYAHQYDRAISLISSNKINVKPMITDTVHFDDSIKTFERAAKNLPQDVKIQIQL